MVMATIAVFGGSGNTGRELISAALAKGLQVRALYRPGSEPNPAPNGLTAITGQLTNDADIRRTLEGTGGAVIVFGPRLSRKVKADVFCAAATTRIIEVMKSIGIDRLVCQTGAMAGGDNPNWSPFVRRFVKSYRRNFPEVDADRDAQEAAVKASGLDWTVVKPFRISNGGAEGRVRVAPTIHIGFLTHVRRPDLARFLADEVTAGKWHRQAVFVVT